MSESYEFEKSNIQAEDMTPVNDSITKYDEIAIEYGPYFANNREDIIQYNKAVKRFLENKNLKTIKIIWDISRKVYNVFLCYGILGETSAEIESISAIPTDNVDRNSLIKEVASNDIYVLVYSGEAYIGQSQYWRDYSGIDYPWKRHIVTRLVNGFLYLTEYIDDKDGHMKSLIDFANTDIKHDYYFGAVTAFSNAYFHYLGRYYNALYSEGIREIISDIDNYEEIFHNIWYIYTSYEKNTIKILNEKLEETFKNYEVPLYLFFINRNIYINNTKNGINYNSNDYTFLRKNTVKKVYGKEINSTSDIKKHLVHELFGIYIYDNVQAGYGKTEDYVEAILSAHTCVPTDRNYNDEIYGKGLSPVIIIEYVD